MDGVVCETGDFSDLVGRGREEVEVVVGWGAWWMGVVVMVISKVVGEGGERDKGRKRRGNKVRY